MAPILRPMVSFSQDDEGHWVAHLSCGHRQHVRHRPPWEVRAWVLTEQGREEHVGGLLPCALCAMPELPAGVRQYKLLGPFTETTAPVGLLRRHTLKAGVWGRIVVLAGELAYVIEREPAAAFLLTPGHDGIVMPEEPHHVELKGAVRFEIAFLSRLPPDTA